MKKTSNPTPKKPAVKRANKLDLRKVPDGPAHTPALKKLREEAKKEDAENAAWMVELMHGNHSLYSLAKEKKVNWETMVRRMRTYLTLHPEERKAFSDMLEGYTSMLLMEDIPFLRKHFREAMVNGMNAKTALNGYLKALEMMAKLHGLVVADKTADQEPPRESAKEQVTLSQLKELMASIPEMTEVRTLIVTKTTQ